MSLFDQSVPASLETIYSIFGESAVFSPEWGDDVACTVIVDKDNAWQYGGAIRAVDPLITINYRITDIDRKVVRGETFTVGSTVYTVVSMAHYPDAWTEYEGRAVVEELG